MERRAATFIALLIIFIAIALFPLFFWYFVQVNSALQPHVITSVEVPQENKTTILEQRILELEWQVNQLLNHPANLEPIQGVWIRAITTAYAPLDPGAIEGMCYSGDPTVTATGARPRYGTLAADFDLFPPGTRFFIPGYGWGIVEDTGGGLKQQYPPVIDLFFLSRDDAFKWGRKYLQVFLVLEGVNDE